MSERSTMLPTLPSALTAWKPVGTVSSTALRATRLTAHWAVQPVGAFGRALVAPRPDDSHTSMSWVGPATLAGQAAGGLRSGLRLDGLVLVLLDDVGQPRAELRLAGRTLGEAFDWLSGVMADQGTRSRPSLTPPPYDLPDHPVGRGEAFAVPDAVASRELVRWYHNAAAIAEAVRVDVAGASPVRCWPHHFDIATLLTLDDRAAESEDGPTIGFGMTPGDDSYDEPYFYFNVWPRPEAGDLPALAGGGIWHTEGWLGAVLPAGRVTGEAAAQAGQLGAFVESALAASRRLMHAT